MVIGISCKRIPRMRDKETRAMGKVETIDSLQTYVAAPTDGSKARTIIFLVDLFGWELHTIRELADTYARAGFYCYIPDIHCGDSFPIEFLRNLEPTLDARQHLSRIERTKAAASMGMELPQWLIRHREVLTKPLIDSFIKTLRECPETSKIGVMGFSWGGRYAVLASQGQVDAVYACDPWLLIVPEDFSKISAPLSLAFGESDSHMSSSTLQQIKQILSSMTQVPNELKIYKAQVHGFTLRCDSRFHEDYLAQDEAKNRGLDWFRKHLV
ncbi:unnamed protein product [Blumeria hordei]|uniref:Dienelactone hydrolase domain-containing protein n=1 Tax=Blumeria hordei TaxID=2867405 RepID=A0A383UY17_BLUHO|nr:unnamed protein product [Blumeria hordei]